MAREKNWMTPLHLAAHNNHISSAGKETLITKSIGITLFLFPPPPLSLSVSLLYTTPVEAIIAHLVNVDIADRTGKTSLHHACYNGHAEVQQGFYNACTYYLFLSLFFFVDGVSLAGQRC